MTPPKHITVVGSLNMDVLVNVSRIPDAGETISGRSVAFISGGKGANQAVACARLGADVSLVGRVGADDFGRQLREALARNGVSAQRVLIDDNARTGVAVVVVDEHGENRIVIVPGANNAVTDMDVQDAGAQIEGSCLMIAQLEIPCVAVESAINRAASAGVPVILNPAPARQLPDEWWPKLDYFIPNETEATVLSGIEVVDLASAGRAAHEFLQRGVRHALVTLGARGVVVADDTGIRHHPAQRVRAVDTTAAGDTFIGALGVGISEGLQLDDAAQRATIAAAICVTRAGAQSSIPYRTELTAACASLLSTASD